MSQLGDALSSIDVRKILLAIAAVIAVVCVICMFSGSCSSCKACESCAACSSCGSCAACSSCGSCQACNACTTCASCGSCTACAACGSCASCENDNKAEDGTVYEPRLNGGKMGTAYYYDSTLYYVSGDSLKSVDSSGKTTVESVGSAITNVCADDTYIYYLQFGNVWRTPREKPLTASDDPAVKYAAERILNATVSGSDAGVTRVIGFSVEDNIISYWGLAAQGGYNILSRPIDGYTGTLLHSGELTNVQVYRGCIYFVSRDEADNGILYSISASTGEKKAITESAVSHYVLSSGCAYVCNYIEGKNNLTQISLSSGKVRNRWVIGDIEGMIANDNWIYYYVNNDMTGGDIYRMKPGTGKATRLFHDSNRISLAGIAGDYFSVYTNTGLTAADRLTNAVFYIFNAETGERIPL